MYGDGITCEPELQDWVRTEKRERNSDNRFTDILIAIDRPYLNHYCQAFQNESPRTPRCEAEHVR